MVPEEKTDAVARAMRETFGTACFEDISPLTGGQTSSLVFRIIVREAPYVLKIITRQEDPTRHYTSMRTAAEAGLAPRVWFTSVEDRISITDFVPAQSLDRADALIRLAALLRKLHALPPFARAPFNTTCTFLLNEGPAVDGYLRKFQSANLLPHAQLEEFFVRHAELAAVYPYDDEQMVSSHNDLFKSDNILFDGRHVLLVDWEAAFLNDRYADLAVVANQVVTSAEDEIIFLQEYFGGPPDHYQSARFHLMQQIAHLFYAMVFLLLGSNGLPIDWSPSVPGFVEFQRRMRAGELDWASKDVQIAYGRIHWERLLHNVYQPRYKEALRVVSGSSHFATLKKI